MKAVITGAAGQLGKALVATAPQGWDCVTLDRAALDLTDPDAIAARMNAERPDLILNAAAYTAVDRAENEPDLARAVNVGAVAALAQAAREHGARLAHVSTDFVFDGTSARAYRPDDTRNPLSVYGRTKAEGEDAAARADNHVIVRTSWVYSAGGANFVRTMLRLMRERDRLGVVADQIGAPTLAGGLARTLWGLACSTAQGIHHHSDAGVASWYDFAVAIQDEALDLGLLEHGITIAPIATSDYPTPATRPAFSLLDDSATRAVLNDDRTHWRHNLRTMLEEEKALG